MALDGLGSLAILGDRALLADVEGRRHGGKEQQAGEGAKTSSASHFLLPLRASIVLVRSSFVHKEEIRLIVLPHVGLLVVSE